MPRFRMVLLTVILAASAGLSMSCAFPTDSEGLDNDEIGATTAAIDDDDDPPTNACLDGASGFVTATPPTIDLWQSTTLQWGVRLPAGCTSVRSYINADVVSRSGSRTDVPIATTTYRLRVSALNSYERELARVTVNVRMPPVVNITSNDWAPLFVQAVQTENTQVVVANHVELDLSNRHDIAVASNVLIQGGRKGLQPGPRLFTTTEPSVLFLIGPGVSGVRMTGLRIDGSSRGVGETSSDHGIMIDSATNVGIANNEIYGWNGVAVEVRDTAGVMESPPTDPAADLPTHTVQIVDNFIHHNQAIGTLGYGVCAARGGHPLIMRNVFDYNRHAIAGDGREGTGYTAYFNLVLENGGKDTLLSFPSVWTHTHQFDMHGRESCWPYSYNCGPAGHTMLIRHNTFFYDEDYSIKLRGTPAVGMFVGSNVFSEREIFGWATDQTESGLVEESGNLYLYDGRDDLGTCDFDGDGLDDTFLATGQTWWFRSGTTAPWAFLNASTKKGNDIELGLFDADNKCDVFDGETMFSGGRPASPRRPPQTLPTIPLTPWELQPW